jgi:2-oxoglutarate ferredoxin oxidoreductase subunit gamma
MNEEMLFAGSGGQGVLTIGNILGNAAMLENFHVTFLPEYGAAMRGGTANCTLCISDTEIASPVAFAPDIILAMNQPSVLSFINRIQSGGQMIYNSSIVNTVPIRGDVEIYAVPASELANELKQPRSTNMVILGSLVKLANVIKLESVNESIKMSMGRNKKVMNLVIEAIKEGYDRFPFEK